MKRAGLIAVVTVMILSAFVFVSCGGGSDQSADKYVGTWKAASISIGDDSEVPDGEWILTINDDGTGTLDDGKEAPSAFTWEPTDGGFKTKGDVKLNFKDDGDHIMAKVIGVNLSFEKQ